MRDLSKDFPASLEALNYVTPTLLLWFSRIRSTEYWYCGFSIGLTLWMLSWAAGFFGGKRIRISDEIYGGRLLIFLNVAPLE